MSELYEPYDKEKDEMALVVGRAVLKFVNPLLISIDGHISQGKFKGQLVVGYVGKLTDFAKEKISKNNPKWVLDINEEVMKDE